MDSLITNINELQGLNIYNQYANDEVYYSFFKLFKQFVYDKYIKQAQDLFNIRFPSKVIEIESDVSNDEAEQAMQYFLFYYSNVFGFYSPLGKASGKVLYDDNKEYDVGFRWDDLQGNGFIPIIDYITIVRYFIDYSSGSWTYGWLSRLIISYVKTTDFIIEPELSGCTIYAVDDLKGKLKILSNIFTNRDLYGFIPLQRVKITILDTKQDLEDEIDRIYKENNVVGRNPNPSPNSEPKPTLKPEMPNEDSNNQLDYVSNYTYYYDSLKQNLMPLDNEKVTWINHIGIDSPTSDIYNYLASMQQYHLHALKLVNMSDDSMSQDLQTWLNKKGKTLNDVKNDRTLRDEAKKYMIDFFLQDYIKQEDSNPYKIVTHDSPNALKSQDGEFRLAFDTYFAELKQKDINDFYGLNGYVLGVKDGVNVSDIDWENSKGESFVMLIALLGNISQIDWKVSNEYVAKRIDMINDSMVLRYYGIYYGANYFIYETPFKVMDNELPNYFNPENINSLHFYELAHLYIANKCTYNTNLSSDELKSLITKNLQDLRLDVSYNNLELDYDELIEIARFLECYSLYMQIHSYSLTSKAGLINIIKPLYKQSSDYVSMLENIKTKVESDFTHTKLYDLKALLNDCNTFVSYFMDKLRIKNNEISLESFLSNVSKASMYEYLVYLFDNKEKGYFALPHHKDIQVSDFLQAQARLKELLANFSDDELELTKPKDTNAPKIQLPNIETQYPDMLEYAWLKLDKFINVDSKRLDSMSETELNDTNRELQLAYNYFGAMYALSVGAQTQEQTLKNLQTLANITQTQISSIDEFLEKYTEIEAKMPTFPVDSNTLRQQLKQTFTQIQQVYNALKVSQYNTMSDENLLIEYKKLSAEMIIKDTKQRLENQGKSEYEIVQNIIAEDGYGYTATTYDELKEVLINDPRLNAQAEKLLKESKQLFIQQIKNIEAYLMT